LLRKHRIDVEPFRHKHPGDRDNSQSEI
jgi:hypothetical protein